MILDISDAHVSYKGIQALKGVTLSIDPGEIVTLIGANGAGKSTLLKAVSGLVRLWRGTVVFNGKNITHLPPDQIVREGICQVPEGRRIFANLTVRENLEIGAYTLRNTSDMHNAMERALVTFPHLKKRLNQYGGTLSGGEQQMLAIGRALMAKPKLLLLDEPSLGLAPFLVLEIFNIIKQINAESTAILLVEQNAHMALSIAHRGYVLETGQLVMADTAAKLLNNKEVKRAYLGE